ncbi:5655_t:CDS:10 [Funneliformis geosporum]|uniref:Eukaryotic translation initiation factor 5B n=1 Tax=Funneliformis geosporum TaxID=1117311 RepID=A0A9W4X3K5_9GLOM|nr:5655_t:CDS:10 [Funneliformis geosporum]
MGKKDKKGKKKVEDDWEEQAKPELLHEEIVKVNRIEPEQTPDDADSQILEEDSPLDKIPVVLTEVQAVQPDDWVDEEFGASSNKADKKKAQSSTQKIVENAQLAAIRKALEAQRLVLNQAKKEQLKKEGKLLSKAQMKKKQQDQLRLQQMMEAGLKIEGLNQEGETKPRKVIYTNKRKQPNKQRATQIEAEPSTKVEESIELVKNKVETKGVIEEECQEKEPEKEKVEITTKVLHVEVKESWEESEDEEIKSTRVEEKESVKDQWDQSTEDESPKPNTPPPTPVTNVEETTVNVKSPVKKSVKEQSETETEESDNSETEDSEDATESDEELTEHQKQLMKRKQVAAERRKKRHEEALAARSKDDLRSPICCILGHVDTGKCFGRGTPILMYDGSVRAVETIRSEEQVMGDDSTPRNVSGVTNGKGLLYKIIPTNISSAQPFVCNDAHILVLKITSFPRIQHLESNEQSQLCLNYLTYDKSTNLVKKLDKFYRYPTILLPTKYHAERAAYKDLELLNSNKNPTISNEDLETILVDFIWQPSVTQFLNCSPEIRAAAKMFIPNSVRFSTREGALAKIIERVIGSSITDDFVRSCAWLIGYFIGTKQAKCKHSNNYDDISMFFQEIISFIKNKIINQETLVSLFYELGILRRKDIPEILMYEDVDSVRLQLIAGMIDSKGSCNSQDVIELTFIDDYNTQNFARLARSCGLRINILNSQNVCVINNAYIIPSVFPRSNCIINPKDRHDQLWEFQVEELGIGEYFGFVVDGNHRFLLSDFTVTHNTKLLDKIRQTNVQEGEAGGITQQIGATYFPMETIKIKTAPLNKDGKQEYKLPGLLIIDTPGHESFTNLRSRGSSLCNIAILVVDIMHGLEPQTLESLKLLRDRKAPFIVALNKIDRMYDWKPTRDNSFLDSFSKQSEAVKREFKDRVEKTILAFAEQGLNSVLYYENKNYAKNVSLVPTSAITGEGIPDMLMLLVNLTQSRMSNELMYLSELECTVLEVKVIEGLGTTIDVILSNGVLNEGDKIVLCGLNGPIVTTIRALLTPQPLRELRIKSAYVHNKSVKAALGVKISAQDLEKAIAGSRLMVVGPDDDEDDLKDEIMSDLKSLLSSIDKSGKGVCVQASTLGSLEALLEFLKTSKIPVSGINIGPVHKRDIMRCATMLEKAKEFAVILCFDVKVDKEAQEIAEELGIKIFKADIIYHLFDQFTAYHQEIVEQKRKDQAPQAIFPCILKIVPGAIFNKRDPIIIGVDVVEGVLKTGTPLCVVKTDPTTNQREIISLGKVSSMEQNHKTVEIVKKGQAGGGIAIKIECAIYENPKMIGRHFVETDEIYSKISRVSIDVLKESFRDDLSKEEWHLMIKLKKILDIN